MIDTDTLITEASCERAVKQELSTMTAIDEIAAERERQKSVEGWTLEHDDEHADGSLADVAACYAATDMPVKTQVEETDTSGGRGDTPVWTLKRWRVPNLHAYPVNAHNL